MSLALALLIGAASETPAPGAETPAEASSPASAQVKAEKSRIRCKSYRPSGTRFDKRVCMTISEWERRREEAREAAKDIQNKPQVCVTGHAYCPGGGE